MDAKVLDLEFFDPRERDYNCFVNSPPVVVILQIVLLNLLTKKTNVYKRTNMSLGVLKSI